MLLILLLAFFGALLPTALYVSIAWWLDRYEKEPWWLLSLTFLWGAIPAIVLAAISQLAILLPLMLHQSNGEPLAVEVQQGEQVAPVALLTVAVVAPIGEELLKAVPLLLVFYCFRREFDGLMDGLLYGALVGFGFAMTENFLYIVGAGFSQGLAAEALVFFLRTIVFGMMHALWSSMLGIGLGIARYTRSRAVAVLAPCAGLLLGMLMHAVHNFAGATMAQAGILAPLLLAIMLGSYGLGCTAWLVLVWVAGRQEAAWIREQLADEVAADLLTAQQAIACGRYRSRLAARWAGLQKHGFGHAHQLSRLYSLGAELAFKKRQLAIHPQARYAGEPERLRQEIRQLQASLASPS